MKLLSDWPVSHTFYICSFSRTKDSEAASDGGAKNFGLESKADWGLVARKMTRYEFAVYGGGVLSVMEPSKTKENESWSTSSSVDHGTIDQNQGLWPRFQAQGTLSVASNSSRWTRMIEMSGPEFSHGMKSGVRWSLGCNGATSLSPKLVPPQN